MPDLAQLNFDGPAAVLTLNRPEARNALSIPLLEALRARVDELAGRADVMVVTITGAGKAFCAGMDLKAVLDGEVEEGAQTARRLLESLAELTLMIRRLPAVTVAKVNSAAIGGGCGLACVCDIAITHADSKMGFPEVALGVCPAVVAPWVVRKIGAGRARRVLLCGGVMSGTDAHALGLTDHIVGFAGELDAATSEIVSRLCAGGPNALRATKALLNELDGSLDGDLLARAAAISAEVLRSPEARRSLRERLTK